MDLTPNQRLAITKPLGNLQLIACAGSGKTEVVARRVVHLLTPGRADSLVPANIVAFTFTDKAAAELKERTVTRAREALGDVTGLAEMFVGTIHAFCLELLKSETPKYLKYEVLNEVQQGLFVDRHSKQSGLTASTDLTGTALKRYRDTKHYIWRPDAHTGSVSGIVFAPMAVHLINPSHVSFGIGVITPRWLYVLASATPTSVGKPILTDETLETLDPAVVKPGDIVGIGIHTGNALRGYEIGTAARAAGAYVVFGGIHATLYPDEARDLGGAHAVVTGDGEGVWPIVLRDCLAGKPNAVYDGGRIEADEFMPGRWDLLPEGRYMWASVQTVRGCPKHCSFCSVWRTDGQRPRQRHVDRVLDEIVDLRRRGFRFIALADDNFYPVTLEDLRVAARREDTSTLEQLKATRAERFELMAGLERLPSDTVFFTQITMEAAEDPEFLDAMRRANIKGALVGVESVTPEGLKDVYKNFNESGEALVERLRKFRKHGVHVLGSFIFGLPSDRPETFDVCLSVAERADITFAQFVMLTPFPGTLTFAAWEKSLGGEPQRVGGIPVSRHWLIPQANRPKVYIEHPVMSAEEIRHNTQGVWDRFYSVRSIWERSRVVKSLKARLAFVLISKLYRQMYANTGIATDSARVNRSAQWARVMAKPLRMLFAGRPMPDLQLR